MPSVTINGTVVEVSQDVLEKLLAEQEKANSLTETVGKAYFIRTVTYHLTGKVRCISGGFLVLDTAAWIADSGRFMNAIKSGTLSEVEPMGDGVFVNIASITDMTPWRHKLPTEQK